MPRKPSSILSHWYTLIEGLQDSSQDFYASLEKVINGRDLPKVKLSRIDHREGSIFSARREYLRVKCREHVFDVCAAPYGKGFFVSWWLGELPGFFWSLILLIPVMGTIMFALFKPFTYYRLDTALMFQESIRLSVLEVIDNRTQAKGLRALSEFERKPILSNLFNRHIR